MMNNGYEKTLQDFHDLLVDSTVGMREFLAKELGLELSRRNGTVHIRDKDGSAWKPANVHQMIQADKQLKRGLYNLWMATYR